MSTSIFVFTIIGIIILYDFYIIFSKGKYHSVSAWIIRYSKNYPIFPFVLGIIFGHLTWSMSEFDYADKEVIIRKCKAYMEENNVSNP